MAIICPEKHTNGWWFSAMGLEKECKDVYEVLAFPIVFRALSEVVFKWEYDDVNTRSWRVSILKRKEILEKMLDFFQNPEDWESNLEKYVAKVEELRKEYKDALEEVNIWDKHKNTYSIALRTLINFKQLNQENVSTVSSLLDQFNARFLETLSVYWNAKKVIWDARWNIKKDSTWGLKDEFISDREDNVHLTKLITNKSSFTFLENTVIINWILMNKDSRQPVKIEDKYEVWIYHDYSKKLELEWKEYIRLKCSGNSICVWSDGKILRKDWWFVNEFWNEGNDLVSYTLMSSLDENKTWRSILTHNGEVLVYDGSNNLKIVNELGKYCIYTDKHIFEFKNYNDLLRELGFPIEKTFADKIRIRKMKKTKRSD